MNMSSTCGGLLASFDDTENHAGGCWGGDDDDHHHNDGDVEEDDHDGQVHKASMVVAPTVMIHTLPIAGRPLR